MLVSTWAATSGRSRRSKPMLIPWHKEVVGVGVNFWSSLHHSGLLDGRFPPRNHLEIQVVHFPVPLTTQTTHHLRFPTRFHRNQNIPQETKLGIGYDFLFLTQKHLTRFSNTKYRNKNKQNNNKITCLAIRWTISKAMASPHSETWHPTSLLAPMVQCRPPSRGSLNKVSSWTAGIAVTVNPSRAPGHRVHVYLLCPQESLCASVCMTLSGCFWRLLTGVTLGSKHIDSSLMTLHFIPKVGVGQPGGWKDLFAFHLGSWWIQSLATRWPRDVDKAKCWGGSEPIPSKVTQSKASEMEKVLLGSLEGSQQMIQHRGGSSYRNTSLRRCCTAQGGDYL